MKVYRVNLTEGELKLFSEFLEQRSFNSYKDERVYSKSKNREILLVSDDEEEQMDETYNIAQKMKRPFDSKGNFDSIGLNKYPQTAAKEYSPENAWDPHSLNIQNAARWGIEDNEKLTKGEKAVFTQDLDIDAEKSNWWHKPQKMPEVVKDGNHRMSKKYIKSLDKEGKKYMKTIMPAIRDADLEGRYGDFTKKQALDLINADTYHAKTHEGLRNKMGKTIKLIDMESDLKDSGYDDNYSAKLTERWLRRKIDPEEAYNIAERRYKLDSKYKNSKNTESKRERKREDRKIIREESKRNN